MKFQLSLDIYIGLSHGAGRPHYSEREFDAILLDCGFGGIMYTLLPARGMEFTAVEDVIILKIDYEFQTPEELQTLCDCLDNLFRATFDKLHQRRIHISYLVSVEKQLVKHAFLDLDAERLDRIEPKDLFDLNWANRKLLVEDLGVLQDFRTVHNVLFCIRGERDSSSSGQCEIDNVLLLYFNPSWNMWLVPNTVDWPETPREERFQSLRTKLAGRLLINPSHLTVHVDEKRSSECIKESRSITLAQQYGPLTRFSFLYCPCEISEPYEHLLQTAFQIHDISYRWVTLSELRNDRLQMQYNWDVVTMLGVLFDISLSGLPLGVNGRIKTQ